MGKAVKAISVIFLMLGIGLYLASMLTNYWVVVWEISKFGLFKKCSPGICYDQGWDVDTVGLGTFIPRILMLVAALFVVIGLLFGVPGTLIGIKNCMKIEGALYIVAGVVVFAACGTFTGLNWNSGPVRTDTLHFSFYMGWVSGLMFIIAGICAVVYRAASSSDY